MISNSKKHKEKMKLSDKFQQPFEVRSGAVHSFVKIFNGKNQKSKKKK